MVVWLNLEGLDKLSEDVVDEIATEHIVSLLNTGCQVTATYPVPPGKFFEVPIFCSDSSTPDIPGTVHDQVRT